MINIKLSPRRAIMRVRLIDRIHAHDFSATVMPAAERLQDRHGGIDLLILDVRYFHGWGAVGTFAEQIRFLRRFGRNIARVAVFGSAAWAGSIPAIAGLFVASEIRCFTPADGAELRAWLRAATRNPSRSDSAPRSCA